MGPGQGSKAGSPTCSTLTFLFLKAMDILAKGLLFASPNQLIHYSTKAILFADNNTNINNNFPNWIHQSPTANTVLNRIQHDFQIWKQCLHTSGGKLKLIKCKYYMLLWQFDDKDKANHILSIDLPTMHLTSGSDSTRHSMSQLVCSITHKTLGAKTSPSLQTKTVFTALDKKTEICKLLTNKFSYQIRNLQSTPCSLHSSFNIYFSCDASYQIQRRPSTIFFYNIDTIKIRLQSSHISLCSIRLN